MGLGLSRLGGQACGRWAASSGSGHWNTMGYAHSIVGVVCGSPARQAPGSPDGGQSSAGGGFLSTENTRGKPPNSARPTVRSGEELCPWVGHRRFAVVKCQLDRMAGSVVDFLMPQIRLEFASAAVDIQICVLCQGGGHGNRKVGNSKILPARAVTHRCEEDPRCSVSIFDQDVLKSPALMRQSDVLVTSRSRFSHLASSLCARGITVALAFWYSHHTSQNVVVADVPGHAVGIQTLLKKSTGSVDFVAIENLITCLKRRKAGAGGGGGSTSILSQLILPGRGSLKQ